MQARDMCVGAGSRDASHRATRPGLKHPGNGPDWARLGDGSEPEADQVITQVQGAEICHGGLLCGDAGEGSGGDGADVREEGVLPR